MEHLAGKPPLQAILRPLELTLVPDTVSSFNEVTNALRYCDRLCTIMANQPKLNNSYGRRVALIQHLFTRVVPLPLPVSHPKRDESCFWYSNPMRYETQLDLLRLLDLCTRHFATASMSLR